MRSRFSDVIEAGRLHDERLKLPKTNPGDRFGFFVARCIPTHTWLKMIACDADERTLFEHVSVSLFEPKIFRCPTWEEMSWVKDQFWYNDETVMQLHVPAAMHVNDHPFVLHLWKPTDREIPLPPKELV